MYMLVLAAIAITQQMGQPPMHRTWTVITGENTQLLGVRGTRLYLTGQHLAAALDVKTGKFLWQKRFKPWTGYGAVNSRTLYLPLQESKTSPLLAIDLQTGASKTLAQLPMETRFVACDEKRVFILLPGGKVRAMNPATGKTLWQVDLAKGQRAGSLASITFGRGRLFTGVEGLGFHCMDPQNGKVLWKGNAQFRTYDAPLLMKEGFVTFFDGIRLHSYETGKPLWQVPSGYYKALAVTGDILVGKDSGPIFGLNLKTGKQAWQTAPDDDRSFRLGGDDYLTPGDADGALVVDKTFMYITKAGKVVWNVPPFFTGRPFFADKERMITCDSMRVLCYEPGASPAFPEDEAGRKALAQKMVAEFEQLDDKEADEIAKLAPYANKALIEKYAQWAIDNDEDGPAHKDGRGLLLYSLIEDTLPRLMKMCTAEDTETLVKAIQRVGPKNAYRDELATILGAKGDPGRVIPMYVKDLKANPPKRGDYWQGGVALQTVAESSHSEAVQFMLAALNDPQAPEAYREQAFVHLAGTGGPQGVAAVKAARRGKKPLEPWESRFGDIESRQVVAEKKDAKGRTWRLVSNGVMGNYSDIYLQQKEANGWSKPIFTSIFTRQTWTEKPTSSFNGIPVKKFLDTEWIRILPEDKSIRTDLDKDGLTDLVEARLGTDAKKGDTDDDGVGDAVDPCPNAAPRDLTDREKIVAACLDARFFGKPWHTPAIIQVEGIKPFETYGYGALMIWGTPEYKGSLPKMYNTGVQTLGFHAPREDMGEDVRAKDWVEISPDGKSAKTTIRRYSGGLNGDGIEAKLIKVGDDWFVISLLQRYVS